MNLKRWRTVFARRLCYKLEDKGISRSELARLIGINKSTVCRYCNGEITPNIYDITAIALVLDCTVDELVCSDAVTVGGLDD